MRKLDSQLGYMPIYTGPELPPGMQLSESGAIVRHLARQNGLDGADAGERCQADMIFEASKGIPLIVGGWRADDALLADGDLSRMQAQLTRIQKLLEANTAGTPHAEPRALCPCGPACERPLLLPGPGFVGKGTTYGDVGMFMALQVLEETKAGTLASLGLAPLEAFRAHMAAVPAVAAYLASDRRVPMCVKEQGRAGWESLKPSGCERRAPTPHTHPAPHTHPSAHATTCCPPIADPQLAGRHVHHAAAAELRRGPLERRHAPPQLPSGGLHG